MWAAEKGHADCVRLLLNAGADQDAKNNVRCECVCRVCLVQRFIGS